MPTLNSVTQPFYFSGEYTGRFIRGWDEQSRQSWSSQETGQQPIKGLEIQILRRQGLAQDYFCFLHRMPFV